MHSHVVDSIARCSSYALLASVYVLAMEADSMGSSKCMSSGSQPTAVCKSPDPNAASMYSWFRSSNSNGTSVSACAIASKTRAAPPMTVPTVVLSLLSVSNLLPKHAKRHLSQGTRPLTEVTVVVFDRVSTLIKSSTEWRLNVLFTIATWELP